jgi:hypothetical protein
MPGRLSWRNSNDRRGISEVGQTTAYWSWRGTGRGKRPWALCVFFTEAGTARSIESGNTLERFGRHLLSAGDSAAQVEETLGQRIQHSRSGREENYVIVSFAPHQKLYVYLEPADNGRVVQFVLGETLRQADQVTRSTTR